MFQNNVSLPDNQIRWITPSFFHVHDNRSRKLVWQGQKLLAEFPKPNISNVANNSTHRICE